jgi:ubiquinone/menaquinone biosynthesis C-methylase UbiE
VRIVQRIVALKGKRVLELGSGDGRLTTDLAQLASSVVAIEPDRARVISARRIAAAAGIRNVSFREGFAERLRARGTSFDVAFFSWSL